MAPWTQQQQQKQKRKCCRRHKVSACVRACRVELDEGRAICRRRSVLTCWNPGKFKRLTWSGSTGLLSEAIHPSSVHLKPKPTFLNDVSRSSHCFSPPDIKQLMMLSESWCNIERVEPCFMRPRANVYVACVSGGRFVYVSHDIFDSIKSSAHRQSSSSRRFVDKMEPTWPVPLFQTARNTKYISSPQKICNTTIIK